ncbi:MAG: hypothetical protein ACFFE4_04020 [Candidatus Thorarchaeota archaeon]
MNLQYYETLGDKSKEYLLYLIEQIQPNFTKSELDLILADLESNTDEDVKKSKSRPKSFVDIGTDVDKKVDLSKLTAEQFKTLFKIFISREENSKKAVKWRFYQNLKYMSELNVKSIKYNQAHDPEGTIDFIIKTANNEVYLASCHDILELSNYDKVIAEVTNYAKKENLLPDHIIFAANKSFRNIPLDSPIKIVSKELFPTLMIEYTEENRQFKREDLLIVNDSELKMAGFNFFSTDDLLNYIYKHSKGGQISIFRQLDFFTGVNDENPEVELFWKGIMIK